MRWRMLDAVAKVDAMAVVDTANDDSTLRLGIEQGFLLFTRVLR